MQTVKHLKKPLKMIRSLKLNMLKGRKNNPMEIVSFRRQLYLKKMLIRLFITNYLTKSFVLFAIEY